MRSIIIGMAAVLLGSASMASETTIDWSRHSISEDATARCIRPGPPSVSDIINQLGERVKNGTIQNIEKLDLSQNNIHLYGATQLFNYISGSLPHLEKLDLSDNKILDERGTPDYTAFQDALTKLLQGSHFQTLNLTLNDFGDDWLDHMRRTLPWDLFVKIRVDLY